MRKDIWGKITGPKIIYYSLNVIFSLCSLSIPMDHVANRFWAKTCIKDAKAKQDMELQIFKSHYFIFFFSQQIHMCYGALYRSILVRVRISICMRICVIFCPRRAFRVYWKYITLWQMSGAKLFSGPSYSFFFCHLPILCSADLP